MLLHSIHDPENAAILDLARKCDPRYVRDVFDQFKFRDPRLAEIERRARKMRATMGRQVFTDGPYVDAPVANLGTLTATTVEALWPSITWTPIFANDAKAGKVYHVRAGGTIAMTGGTAIFEPRWNPAGTTGGVSLTVGTVTTLIAAWYCSFDLVFRVIGAAGANSTCIGTGFFAWNGGVVSGTANPNLVVFGGTQIAVDSTINGSVEIRKTLSAANSVIPNFAYIHSLN